MSFLGGGGGAECSAGANPLSQFSKHVQDDTSLQRDRLVAGSSAELQETMRSSQPGVDQAHHMEEFMHRSMPLPQFPTVPLMGMEKVMPNTSTSSSHHPAVPSEEYHWVHEFGSHVRQGKHDSKLSPAEFAQFNSFPAEVLNQSEAPLQYLDRPAHRILGGPQPFMNTFGMASPPPMGLDMGMGIGMGPSWMPPSLSYLPQAHQQQEQEDQLQNEELQQHTSLKGKERLVELEDTQWEAHFAQLGLADTAKHSEAQPDIVSHDIGLDSETNHNGDFESIWRGIQEEAKAAKNLADDIIDDEITGYWNGFDGMNTIHSSEAPDMGVYMFEEQNPFLQQAHNDPFSQGVEIMDMGGNLSLAALAFEAAVQKLPDHVEAWVRLGTAQAQNEKETPAVRALEHALTLDPSNQEALMGLAVSYINEGYEHSAFRSLERWIASKYPQVAGDRSSEMADGGESETDRNQLLRLQVTEQFINAARLSPSGTQMDPDVQVGLGVLFYAADEFPKAIDCFQAALASTEAGVANSRNQVHLLWNRLGATLANSGSSEDAIFAYQRALEHRPNFVRARYNLAVSCINMNALPEAAVHLLEALEMHRVAAVTDREKAREIIGGGSGNAAAAAAAEESNVKDSDIDRLLSQNESTNLYDTMRRVFMTMGHNELADGVGPGMDLEHYKREFGV